LSEGRQASDRGAVGLVGGRLFLHLRSSRVGILFIPIVERATIILQAEDAIALIEIEISAVQFVAMR
jgi:hypothetical protein